MTESTKLTLTAEADVTLLARVAGLLSSLSLLPTHVSMDRRADGTIVVYMELSGGADRIKDLLQRKLLQLPQLLDLHPPGPGRPLPIARPATDL